MMDRRRFLLTSLASVVTATAEAEAQQGGKVYRIGVLFEGSRLAAMQGPEPRSPILREFFLGLRDLGYVEGQNVVFERRSAEGRPERLPTLVAELIGLRVDVILASGEETTPAILAATDTIPVVQPTLMDPVERGYVHSLARPGRNVTGLHLQVDRAVYGKQLELLKEAAPSIERVAILHRIATGGSSASPFASIAPTAKRLRVKVLPVVMDREDQLVTALATLERERADALIVEGNAVNNLSLDRIIEFAVKHRLATSSTSLRFADAGGLISYGSSVEHSFRRAAVYVDKILKGAKAGSLPIERPTTFMMAINLKTAKTLRLTIPPSLLLRADHVIE